MNDLITVEARGLITQIVETKGNCIPAVIGDVRDALLFTRTKSKMLREALKGIESIDGAEEMQDALGEQNDEAWLALQYMTARLGELTARMEEIPRAANVNPELKRPEIGKMEQLKRANVDFRQSAEAERIAANTWAIDEEFENKKSKGKQPSQSGVLNRIREREAEQHATRKREKADDRKVRETPRIVAEYLAATKAYRESLELAIAGAKRDRFDPNAWNFIAGKHDQIRKLMAELEGLV